MKRFSAIVSALVLSMAVTSFPALAAGTYTTEVTNRIFLGDIRISLEELSGDGSAVSDAAELVVPGQRVTKTLRIHNEANTAWIRAKLEYPDSDGFRGFSDDDIELASDKWVKRGAYFYYTEPVAKQQYVDLLKAIRIPSSWDASRAGSVFSINTTVDAVQTANFTPDFTAEDPWFGTVIEACVHTGDSAASVSTAPFTVTFEGGAAGIVRVGDDFFSHWGELMPGDTVSDTVTVGNAYARPTYVYFRTETTADDALLKQLKLAIRNGDTVIYDGTMDGTIGRTVTLGYFAKGESTKLSYTVSVPASLRNSYGLSDTQTKWIFTCEYGSTTSGGGGGGGTPSGSASSDPKGPTGQPETTAAVETTAESTTATAESSAAGTTADSDREGSSSTAGRGRYSDGSDGSDGSGNDGTDGRTSGKRKNPKTGDESQTAAYMVSAGLFGLAAAGIVLMDRKQKRRAGQNQEKH